MLSDLRIGKKYNPKAACAAQEAYCRKNQYPYFAPPDGICFRCGRNIYAESQFGYTVETASSTLITGCPFCNTSYCE